MKRIKNRKACHYANPPKRYNPKATVIPVEIVELEDSSYHLIAKVEIDGIQGDMIIDTGASVTVIDQKIFPDKQNDDTMVKIQSGSVSGQISNVRLIKVGYFKIGGRKLKDFRLAGIDLDYVNDVYHKHLKRNVIGLLGCDFCVRYKVTINYQSKELTMNK